MTPEQPQWALAHRLDHTTSTVERSLLDWIVDGAYIHVVPTLPEPLAPAQGRTHNEAAPTLA